MLESLLVDTLKEYHPCPVDANLILEILEHLPSYPSGLHHTFQYNSLPFLFYLNNHIENL